MARFPMTSIRAATPRAASCAIAALALLAPLAGCAGSRQALFATPDEATDAFIGALVDDDTQRLEQIFGPDVDELLDSGDPVADAERREVFLEKFAEGHGFADGPDGSLILQVGNDDWPFAIPLVRSNDTWRFDTAAGRDEIIARRIGTNELDAIATCLAYVDAQFEYAMLDPDDDAVREYARRIVSDPGTRNGLYWPTNADEPPSPLGTLVAAAAEEGYEARRPGEPPRPYHGYFYRVLLAQGPGAEDGERDYVVRDRMIGGFALLAWPASYDNSGVMTFVVNQDGVVYQKDLGPDTPRVASTITAFDPDDTWQPANAEPYLNVVLPER